MPRDYHRNHVASASYLAGFANCTGELCAVETTEGTSRLGRPRTMGYRPAFWGKDREVRERAERWLSTIENDIPSAVSRLIADGVPEPGSEHRLALMLLMAIHGVRSPATRANVLAVQQHAIAEHADKYRSGITEAQYGKLLARWTSDSFVAQLMLGHVSKLASFLGSMHWTLVEFDASLLATSDQPMVLVPMSDATALADTLEGRFAVGPRHALILAWADIPDGEQTVAGDDALAAHLNRAVIAQADTQWFHHPERRPVRSIATDLKDLTLVPVAERIHDGYDEDEARMSQRRRQAVANVEELIERQEPGLIKSVSVS
ncbi:MAG TPA: DUF4238 domain-containing protein [Baekduia sp.]|uniref:DUF4238 domain-containing protein n=1 Tax=Baekduia sp. TaxID=2600305 RepID=UPI002BD0E1BD|nr:DUF4238 domain-containing protein [Baekduia sp.]HMJ36660.1 DUF4238 domain-containing protein [Baekduia sp.]